MSYDVPLDEHKKQRASNGPQRQGQRKAVISEDVEWVLLVRVYGF